MIAERSSTIKVLDQDLEYRWFGDLSSCDTPIVLLHEGLGSVSMWKSFPQRLSEKTGKAVLAYSRAGYGSSSPAALPRNPQYMHDEAGKVLPALLAALDVHKPILLGHSDGASIALLYAGLYPTQAKALILEAPHVFVEQLTIDSIAEAKVAYQATDLRAKLGRYHADPEHVFWGWNDIWLSPAFRAWDITDILPAIRCPVLMIQGCDDEYGTAAQLDAISAVVPDWQTVMLESCGHSPHRDQLDSTLKSIDVFVRALHLEVAS